MPLVDTHAHLDSPRFDGDREAVIRRAREAGVIGIITCGVDLPTSRAASRLAHEHPDIHAAVGVHAHDAQSAVRTNAGSAWRVDDDVLASLANLAGSSDVVALGELGLDYHYDHSPRDVQRAVLAAQLRLACELDLPVILHNRESDADLVAIVDDAPASLRGVLHCFMGETDLAEWAIERGLYIGIAGPITFKNVRHLPEVVRRVPLDRLLVETDSPYLAPHPRRGRRNEPAYVAHVAERLAKVLGLSVEDLGARTTQNARRLFNVA